MITRDLPGTIVISGPLQPPRVVRQRSKGTIWEAGAQVSWALSKTLSLQQEKQEKAFTITIRLHDKCHLAACHSPLKTSVCFPGQQPPFYEETCLHESLYDRRFPWSSTSHTFLLTPVDHATVLLGPVSAFTASKEGDHSRLTLSTNCFLESCSALI